MMESKRVKIYPASKEQMENQIVAEKDPELKKAYKEMLQGCIEILIMLPHRKFWKNVASKLPALLVKKGQDIFCIERKSKQPLTQVFLAHIKMHTRTIIFTCNYIIYFFNFIPF